jgi:hypothetical protein
MDVRTLCDAEIDIIAASIARIASASVEKSP